MSESMTIESIFCLLTGLFSIEPYLSYNGKEETCNGTFGVRTNCVRLDGSVRLFT